MVKKIFLSAALLVSTLATAQINLDLNFTLFQGETPQTATGSVVAEENESTAIVFDGLEGLVVDCFVTRADDKIVIQTHFLQTMENDELLPMADLLEVTVPLNEPAIFNINQEDESPLFTLVVVPSEVE